MEKGKKSQEKESLNKNSGRSSAREFSAGGVVFKKIHKKSKVNFLWLVTKSAPSSSYPKPYWRLPKGWLDDSITNGPGPIASGLIKATETDLQKGALREVAEEGGVKAKIIEKLGTEKLFITKTNQKVFKFVTYYLMEWLSNLSEGPGFETSEIAWLSYQKARKKLKHYGEKKMLDDAKQILDLGVQENLI